MGSTATTHVHHKIANKIVFQQNFIYKNKRYADMAHRLWFANPCGRYISFCNEFKTQRSTQMPGICTTIPLFHIYEHFCMMLNILFNFN